MTYAIVNKFSRSTHHQFPVNQMFYMQITALAANAHFIAIRVLTKQFRSDGASPRSAAKGLACSALPNSYPDMIAVLQLDPHQADPLWKQGMVLNLRAYLLKSVVIGQAIRERDRMSRPRG